MNIAKALAEYRLFRPLGFHSDHYDHYNTDQDLAESITAWCSNILLGGKHYNLGVNPEHIFQIPSNKKNRMVFIVPILDSDLIREIVLASENKTDQAKQSCGYGSLEKIEYAGGILYLKRSFYRGDQSYQTTHSSATGWFVADQYHLDVRVRDLRCGCRPSILNRLSNLFRQNPTSPFDPRSLQIGLRLYHDSLGCIALPNWSPGPDRSEFNKSVKDFVNECFPRSDDLILNWHEVVALLDLSKTGIYALSNIISMYETGLLIHDSPISNLELRGITSTNNNTSFTPLSIPDFTQPLPNELINIFEEFQVRILSQFLNLPPFIPFVPDTYMNTPPPSNELGNVMINFLEESLGSYGSHIYNGYFRVTCEDSTILAAGTGNWGSAEQMGVSITVPPPSSPQGSGLPGYEDIQGRGFSGLLTDAIRYLKKEEIREEINNCRNLDTYAECYGCVQDSTGEVLHNIGIGCDVNDVVGGIALCVAGIFLGPAGAAILCGIGVPIAGASAAHFWENTFDGYDYSADMCAGLPNNPPNYQQPINSGQPGTSDDPSSTPTNGADIDPAFSDISTYYFNKLRELGHNDLVRELLMRFVEYGHKGARNTLIIVGSKTLIKCPNDQVRTLKYKHITLSPSQMENLNTANLCSENYPPEDLAGLNLVDSMLVPIYPHDEINQGILICWYCEPQLNV